MTESDLARRQVVMQFPRFFRAMVTSVIIGLMGALPMLFTAVSSAAPLPSPLAAAAASSSFTPGAQWTDQNGNPLQMHGLGIIKVGSTWYGFGEDKTGESSSATYFQDIPCYSSTDLAHWTYLSKALTLQSS